MEGRQKEAMLISFGLEDLVVIDYLSPYKDVSLGRTEDGKFL
jgi:hypothetical protein